MKPIVLDPAVEGDIKKARAYYEEQRPGLGVDFENRVFTQFDRIALYPLAAPVVEGRIRKIGVEKFPYEIYYRVDQDQVFVHSVTHYRRHSDFWKRRT